MKKKKWNLDWKDLKEKLSFLRLEADPDQEEELQVEERTATNAADLPEGNLKQKLERNRRNNRIRRTAILAIALVIIGSFALYNSLHVFRDYVITVSAEASVASGTKYESAGSRLYRYNADGVSSITRNNETEWSITYNMQAPIVDVCGSTMVIAEQQGTQVYVVNEDGLVGNFATDMPILKACVSRQGIVAVVLEQDNITWVNLYQADGTVVANDKTTISESGYPLDIALSPDGQKLMVSYLRLEQGVMKSEIVFYHFGSAGQSKENNIVSNTEYQGTVIPEVYFTDNAQAVAVADEGFYVFSGKDAPKQQDEVKFDQEIVSCFHDDSRIGFLFRNEDGDSEYLMELYNYSGRRKASRKIDSSFTEIKMENGQILMYSDNQLNAFSGSGRLRFSSAYESDVEGFFYFGEFRKYMVASPTSLDRIRIS